MRQLPSQTSDTPAPRPATRCQTSAPRNGSRQTIATDLRRVSEPLPAASPNASSQVETQKGPTAYYHTVGPSRVVPRAGARILVTGGDYCVFICGHQVIEHQFVMPFVEVVKTIPGKCGQSLEKGSKNVVKLWPNLGDTRNKTL